MIDLSPDDLQMLEKLPLFSSLSAEDWQAVLRESVPKMIETGQVLFAEGDVAEAAYVILSGTIEVYLERDTPVTLAELGRGGVIGEQALVPGGSGRRSASARVREPGIALEIPLPTFQARILTYESNRRAVEQAATEQLYDRLVKSLPSFHALQATPAMPQILRRTYHPGEVVIQYGAAADAAYFVLSGYARATRPSPDGGEQAIARIGPGQCFGELALIESQPRAATVAAEGTLEVLRVESELFLRWYREQPDLRDLLKTLRQVYLLEDKSTILVHRGTYEGSPSVTSLRQQPDGSCLLATQVLGKEIFALSFSGGADVGPTESVEYAPPDRPVRRVLYHVRGRLTGVVAQGVGPDVGTLYQLVAHQAEIPKVQLARFRWTGVLRDPRLAVPPDIVCTCCKVGKRELFDAAGQPRTWESIQNATGAGLICGTCVAPIRAILDQVQESTSKPAAPDPQLQAAREKTFELSIVPNRTLDHLPGDDGLPVLGHGLAIFLDAFRFISDRAARYGAVFRVNALGERWVVVGLPEGAREVLTDSKRNFSNRLGWNSLLGKLLAGGLLLRDFDDHQQHRRIMEKAFRHEALVHYLKTANAQYGAGIDRWPVGRPFAFFPAMTNLNLDLAAQIFLGVPLGPEADLLHRSLAALGAAEAAIIKREVPGLSFRRGMQGRRYLTSYFAARVAERRKASGDDMFTQLCQAVDEDGRRFTDQEIVDHLIFFMLAAHDPTTCALTTMVWLLVCFPQWQDRLRQETEQLGKETLDYADKDRLPLIGCFIKETLRRYAPIPLILRRSIEACTILGREIPANTQVAICPLLLHHDPDYWTAPDRFDPERFSEARAEDSRHSHCFIPFGGGAHSCLGMHFAVLEIKAFLVQLLRRYRIRLKPGQRVTMTWLPFTRPTGGLPVILERL
jgi:cytochrome P450/CRP-like cAMP-binding protein/bacterioferritin-associated ferredoxin